MTKAEIERQKYIICCPMCDLKKCLKGTDKCEAEQWAKERRRSMSNCMTFEDYLRVQVERGQYSVDIIQAQVALDIANYIEKHRQPERKTGRWIPCSERLPEEDKEVLISYRYKEGEGDTSHVEMDITTYGQMYFGGNKVGKHKHWRAPFEYFESNYEVIAWMPLPEPYKGVENDQGKSV